MNATQVKALLNKANIPAYHRDPRVIAARKQYRFDLKTGIPEKQAWTKANAVFTAVRKEIETREES